MLFPIFLLGLSFPHVFAEFAYAPFMPISKALADDLQSGSRERLELKEGRT